MRACKKTFVKISSPFRSPYQRYGYLDCRVPVSGSGGNFGRLSGGERWMTSCVLRPSAPTRQSHHRLRWSCHAVGNESGKRRKRQNRISLVKGFGAYCMHLEIRFGTGSGRFEQFAMSSHAVRSAKSWADTNGIGSPVEITRPSGNRASCNRRLRIGMDGNLS